MSRRAHTHTHIHTLAHVQTYTNTGAQQEAASHNTPPYTTDENGMLMYQYDQDYVAKNYEVFDLRVYHRCVLASTLLLFLRRPLP
jgi:predicted lipoprotein with Yx(FWY)xxD motif